MKKILVIFLGIMMICSGCSSTSKDVKTFMVTNFDKENELYALSNTNGKTLTEYKYKTYIEVGNNGFIVTDKENKYAFVDNDGDEVIAFGTYEILKPGGHYVYGIKKKDDDQSADLIKKSNLDVVGLDGKVVLSADEKTGVIPADLPIVVKDNHYSIYLHDDEVLYESDEQINNVSTDDLFKTFAIELKDQIIVKTPERKEDEDITLKQTGNFKVYCSSDNNALLYNATSKTIVYVDLKTANTYSVGQEITNAFYDENFNLLVQNNNLYYLINNIGTLEEVNAFYKDADNYVLRNTVNVYGPHYFVSNQEKKEITQVQIHPKLYLVNNDYFPVYVRDSGYKYYNFSGASLNDEIYKEAKPFDINDRAIVKEKDDQVNLIDMNGAKFVKTECSNIEYIGGSYYAVYNEKGIYGVIDAEGKEILPTEYTELPDTAYFTYNNINYLLLNKNGRSYIYDIEKKKEIFSIEKELTYVETGYLMSSDAYYTIEGDLIK